MFDSLARLADSRARRVVIVAAILFIAAGALGGSVASRLDPYQADDPATESVKATKALEDAGYRETGVIVLVDGRPVSSAATQSRVAALERQLRAREDVATVTGYYDTHSPAFVSRNGHMTYLSVALKTTDDKQWQDSAKSIESQLGGRPGVSVGGPALANAQVNHQTERDLRMAELLAFPLLFLLSLLFFRSLVASLLPLLVGALAIVGTFLVLRIASELTSVSIFALNLTTGLGLGLAIDYSLFVVSRYREEIAKQGPGLAAMRRTLATAGRTVLFSSLTVAVALASLCIFPQRFLYSMGLGGSIVALLAAAVALTVLPAVLTLLGHRVNSLAPRFLQKRAERDARPTESGFWYRLSRFVMRRPIPIAAISAVALIALGLPFLGIKYTYVDASILPKSASARQVDDVMRAQFPPYHDTPIVVDLENGDRAAANRFIREVKGVDGVASVNPPRRLDSGAWEIEAYSTSWFASDASRASVERIRDLREPPGSQVLVTGRTADFVDFQHSLVDHGPIALGIVVAATLLILFLMTGSVVLPIKSLLMNVLNLSAVFGVLVLIFQDGRLESLLGYTGQGALEQTMPLLIFAVGFGLSTDYAVFLLSRIKEARDGGASDTEAVAIGVERTGRIVTAAAVLFSIAVGAMATSQIIFIKETALGWALTVLIDAFVIRALLVPSLMELLGEWNWWAPRPLRRLHRRFGLSEGLGRARRTPAPRAGAGPRSAST